IDVHRLKVAWRLTRNGESTGHMRQQRTMRRRRRWEDRHFAARFRRGKARRHQTDSRRFHITFAAGDLARETDMGARLQSQRLVEKRGRVQKRVAVEAAKPRKLGLLQARDGAKEARLLAVFHLGLEADHVEERAKRIIL